MPSMWPAGPLPGHPVGDDAVGGEEGKGWINILGHLKVPFFERPAVHLITLANEATHERLHFRPRGGDLDRGGGRPDFSPASDPFHFGRSPDATFFRNIAAEAPPIARSVISCACGRASSVSSISSSQRAGIPSCAVFGAPDRSMESISFFRRRANSRSSPHGRFPSVFGASVDTLPQIRQTGAEVRVIRRLADGEEITRPEDVFQRLGAASAEAPRRGHRRRLPARPRGPPFARDG